MHDNRVAGTDKAHQCFELWTFSVFAGGFVGEGFSDFDSFQLPFRVLVKGADPYVADALSKHAYTPFMSS
jgi:hypothetical protein